MNTATPRQQLVDRYIRTGIIGAALVLIYPALHIMWATGIANTATVIATIIGVLVLFFGELWVFSYLTMRRKADEFTHAMWHSGTTVAFFAIVVWLLLGTLVESAFAAFEVAHDPTRSDPEIAIIQTWALPITLAGFFIGFHYKRLRGDF